MNLDDEVMGFIFPGQPSIISLDQVDFQGFAKDDDHMLNEWIHLHY